MDKSKQGCQDFVYVNFPRLIVTPNMVYRGHGRNHVAVKGLSTSKALEERRLRALKPLPTGRDCKDEPGNIYISLPKDKIGQAFTAGICFLIFAFAVMLAVIIGTN